MTQIELPGIGLAARERSIDRYGVWPTTVWDVDVREDRSIDASASRAGLATNGMTGEESSPRPSRFSPAVAAWAINCWLRDCRIILDPMGGGAVRRAMVDAAGISAVTGDLSVAQVVEAGHGVAWDAAHLPLRDSSIDGLLTCPPYWSLERYSDDDRDVSAAPTVEAWRETTRALMTEWRRVAADGCIAVVVIGMIRADPPSRSLHPLHHWWTADAVASGWSLVEEVVLRQVNNAGPMLYSRMAQFERGRRLLARTHEYCLVFEARAPLE